METILPILQSVGTVDCETNYIGRHGKLFSGFRSHYALETLKLNDNLRKEILEIAPFVDERQLVTKLFSGNYQIIFISVAMEHADGIIYRNRKNGIRLHENGMDLTDEENWDKLILNKSKSKIHYTREILQRFKDNYEYDSDVTIESIVENLKKIHSHIPSTTLLVLLLGSEFNYEGFKSSQIVLYNQKFNAAIEKEFSNFENVRLINYTKFIHSKNDYDQSLEMSNHFARRIYFEIAADMVKIANEYLKRHGFNAEIKVKPKSGIKSLVWCTNSVNYKIIDLCRQAEDKDFINIVGYAIFENNHVTVYEKLGGKIIGPPPFQIVIVAEENNFYELLSNVPANMLVDGRVFKIPNLNFSRFYNERVAYNNLDGNEFSDESRTIYQRVCIVGGNVMVILGRKSYVKKISFIKNTSFAEVRIGNFTVIDDNVTVHLRGENQGVSNYYQQPITQTVGKIFIGADVKINSNAVLISNGTLTIGDGAIIEENSVVTKSVPPYAIVAGNPAQIIDYRFSQEIIDTLRKIKWWDWDFDKIHKNLPLFSDTKKFLEVAKNF